MATFLVAHGAWSAGWAWKRMHPRLRAAGHELLTPTYTGLGERGHLAGPAIDLETHVADILGVLEFEDLRDVVLIGHSYGGVVATAVADRAAERLARLVYLDAFVPRDGQSMFDLLPPRARDRMREQARAEGEGWRVPPTPIPPDTDPADLPWLNARRMPQPLATFEQPLRLAHGETALPRSYVYCTRIAPGDVFRAFADRARQETGWRYHELDASHSPAVTAPDALARLLEAIVTS
jgi:pimeloyl-ACP methyl ester carboxylesterase